MKKDEDEKRTIHIYTWIRKKENNNRRWMEWQVVRRWGIRWHCSLADRTWGWGRERGRQLMALPAQDLAHAAVRDPELPRDVAWPDTLMRQLHDPLPYDIRQWTAVDEHAAQLVDPTVTWKYDSTYMILTVYQTDWQTDGRTNYIKFLLAGFFQTQVHTPGKGVC